MDPGIDWNAARKELASRLTSEEERIVEMLANGNTQSYIATTLGQHRSMVWRKVQRLKAKLREHSRIEVDRGPQHSK